jgi:hypothetical protein
VIAGIVLCLALALERNLMALRWHASTEGANGLFSGSSGASLSAIAKNLLCKYRRPSGS